MAREKVRDSAGNELDAEFTVTPEGEVGHLAVVVESRSGRRGPGARNTDYEKGMAWLLTRLAALDARLLDATVESTETVGFAHSDKVLTIVGAPYPVRLSEWDLLDLRLRIARAQEPINRDPNAKGGNRVKRMRMLVEVPESTTAAALLDALGHGISDPARAVEDAVKASSGRSSGQGFAADKQAIDAIEAHAMKRAEREFRKRNWDWQDVHTTKSYDYLCTRGDEVLRVEVKGTTGSQVRVIVTDPEVTEARSGASTALLVVTDIDLNRIGGIPRPRGGKVTWIEPWDVDAGTLNVIKPIRYWWRAPE